MSAGGGLLLVVAAFTVLVATLLFRQRVLRPRERRRAAALHAEIQLQLLTHAAVLALLDEARRSLVDGTRRTP